MSTILNLTTRLSVGAAWWLADAQDRTGDSRMIRDEEITALIAARLQDRGLLDSNNTVPDQHAKSN